MTLSNKFNTMLDRLQISFNRVEQFSSDISHELRNPLNNLIGSTELVLSKTSCVNEYQTVLESNMEEYQHLKKLIDRLLFLAKSDSGAVVVSKTEINVADEISKIVEYYQDLVDEKNITLSIEGSSVSINADPILFKQVINNLLLNAIKYSKSGGSIIFGFEKSSNNTLCIKVKDSGIGIDEQHLPYIFERFYRVDGSRAAMTGGVGLGLAICKSIIELHDGQINVDSQLGKGSTFTITLPII